MDKKDCFYLGTITKKFSFKGEVLVKIDTDSPEIYNNLNSVLIDSGIELISFSILKCKIHKPSILRVNFFKINSEEDANNLIKKKLYLPLSMLPKLEGNNFYYHEVIGFEVYDDQKIIGVIEIINDQTSQALFEIKANNKLILVPIHDDFIVKINRLQKKIILKLPEGLTDLQS